MWNGSLIKRKRDTTNRKRRRQQKIELPQDIIVWNILPRLPVKSLLRFKFVCKEWKSLITDNRDFANLQLDFQHYNKTYDQYYLVQGYPKERRCYNRNNSSLFSLKLKIEPSHQEVVVAETRKFSRNVTVLGSSNGLICLSHDRWGMDLVYPRIIKRYELWNPATRSRWHIPAPPRAVSFFTRLQRPCYYIICEGFVYIPSLDDYKIVILRGLVTFSSQEPKVHHALTYSCRTNTWKQIKQREDADNDLPVMGFKYCKQGVQVGESLHWGLSIDSFLHYPIHPAVLAFNLANDSIYWLRFSLPDSCSPLPYFYSVSKFRERLCVSWPNGNNQDNSYRVDVVCMLDDVGLNWKRIFTLENVDRFGSYESFLEVNNNNDDTTTVVMVNHDHRVASVTSPTRPTGAGHNNLPLQLHPLVFSGDSYVQLNPLVFPGDQRITAAIDYIQTLITPFTSNCGPTTLLPMEDL